MAPVFSRIALTREYLDAQKNETGLGGLTSNHLLELIRVKRNRERLFPGIALFEAAKAVVDEPITVNWRWVVIRRYTVEEEQTMPSRGSEVDQKVATWYDQGLITLPVDQEFLAATKDQLLEEIPARIQNEPDPNANIPHGPGTRPVPLRRTVWKGSNSDLKYAHHGYWQLIKSDSVNADFKMYDVKVVLVNYFGDDENEVVMARLNTVDITDLATLNGYNPQARQDDLGEIEDPHPDELTVDDAEFGCIWIMVNTRKLLDRVIFTGHVVPQDEPYTVSWHFPGYEPAASGFHGTAVSLFTYHPDQTPSSTWSDVVDTEHTVPALGHPSALRIVLSVSPYEPEGPNELTDAEKQTVLVAEYLVGRDGNCDILKAIRLDNKGTKASRGRGQTPKRWTEWVTRIYQIKDYELRVPHSALDESIHNVVISKLAIGASLNVGGPWVAKCLTAYDLIKKRRLWPGVEDYLEVDGSKDALGIQPFIVALGKFKKR
ncbi:hypothetical protein DFH06DRAFT_1344967 [Mycena polygramma]|nr:hypothetical protein DFH06DRAFT_1344967 [Mycena polygramma]